MLKTLHSSRQSSRRRLRHPLFSLIRWEPFSSLWLRLCCSRISVENSRATNRTARPAQRDPCQYLSSVVKQSSVSRHRSPWSTVPCLLLLLAATAFGRLVPSGNIESARAAEAGSGHRGLGYGGVQWILDAGCCGVRKTREGTACVNSIAEKTHFINGLAGAEKIRLQKSARPLKSVIRFTPLIGEQQTACR